MSKQCTLSIIKPDAVSKGIIGKIISRFEEKKLNIVAANFQKLSQSNAERFYIAHNSRPFFKSLINFMTSGPVFVQVLEGENAVQRVRNLIGHTDPIKADSGTIRADFADSIEANAIHGSDSIESAAIEIAFFFPEINIYYC